MDDRVFNWDDEVEINLVVKGADFKRDGVWHGPDGNRIEACEHDLPKDACPECSEEN